MTTRDSDSPRDDSNTGFLVGLLAGTAIGAGLALLFASKPGAEVRSDIRKVAEGAVDAVAKAASAVRKEAEPTET
jgi:gas vesicle protein